MCVGGGGGGVEGAAGVKSIEHREHELIYTRLSELVILSLILDFNNRS